MRRRDEQFVQLGRDVLREWDCACFRFRIEERRTSEALELLLQLESEAQSHTCMHAADGDQTSELPHGDEQLLTENDCDYWKTTKAKQDVVLNFTEVRG